MQTASQSVIHPALQRCLEDWAMRLPLNRKQSSFQYVPGKTTKLDPGSKQEPAPIFHVQSQVNDGSIFLLFICQGLPFQRLQGHRCQQFSRLVLPVEHFPDT